MFTALMNRTQNTSWQKIPWHDPDFSRRMLNEHLSQSHDLASRRFSVIDQHVQWIHHEILNGQPSRILDLGCGPGFYSTRLTALGHTCTGIDFSPASIAYAREHSPASEYILGNMLHLNSQQEFDLVMLIYGELNAFAPNDALRIVTNAHAALKSGGKLLLEVHSSGFVYQIGHQPSSWHTADKGLFSDEPYLCLQESGYNVDHAVSNYYVFAADSGAMQQYTTMLQAYTDDEYRQLLAAFNQVNFYTSLTSQAESNGLFALLAQK